MEERIELIIPSTIFEQKRKKEEKIKIQRMFNPNSKGIQIILSYIK
jgi:hypothetical protein